MQWSTIFQKELLENWRNKKWIWVPLVIILLSIMDPISNYFLPEIIDAVGGMPEGAVFEIPDYAPAEVVMMSLSQLSSLGVLVVVLISMRTITGELKSGVTELILVKPVSYSNYITAKWTSFLLLVWVSLFLGLLGSWYYVNILYGDLAFTVFLKVFYFYGLWMTLVISFSIFYNTVFKSSGLVAFFTILTIMVMSIVTKVFQRFLAWSPNNISSHISEMLVKNEIGSDLWGSAVMAVVISVLLIVLSVLLFRRKELVG